METDVKRFMIMNEVEALTSLKRSTIYGLMRSGEFPQPVKLTPGRSAWREEDIKEWIDSRTTAVGGRDDR